MKTYRYTNRAGGVETVEADRVEFAPGHVVFWSGHPFAPRLVLARANDSIRRLEEVEPDAEV